MAEMIEREVKTLSLSLGTSLGATPDIEMEGFVSGTIFIPAGSPITSISWQGAPYSPDQPSGAAAGASPPTYQPLVDATLAGGVAQTQVVAAGNAVAMPAALFGCAAVKAVVNAAGPVLMSLKS